MSAHALLDKAEKVCGSRYKLAKLTGLSQSYLSMVVSGERALSPLAAAKIAHVAGVDPRDAMAVAAIENEQDPVEREALKRVFFRVGTVATLLISTIAGWIAPSPSMAAQVSAPQVRPGTSVDSPPSVYYVNLLARWLRRLTVWLTPRATATT